MYARPFPRVDGPLLCALMSLRFFFYERSATKTCLGISSSSKRMRTGEFRARSSGPKWRTTEFPFGDYVLLWVRHVVYRSPDGSSIAA